MCSHLGLLDGHPGALDGLASKADVKRSGLRAYRDLKMNSLRGMVKRHCLRLSAFLIHGVGFGILGAEDSVFGVDVLCDEHVSQLLVALTPKIMGI